MVVVFPTPSPQHTPLSTAEAGSRARCTAMVYSDIPALKLSSVNLHMENGLKIEAFISVGLIIKI